MVTIRPLIVLATSLVTGACFQSTALVRVNADGSGTIEHQTVMTTAALAQLRQLAGSFGATNGKPVDPFSEDDARAAVAKMGDGVWLASSTPLKTDTGEGRTNVYGFRDIRNLRLEDLTSAGRGPESLGAGAGGTRRERITADLVRNADGHALLTVHSPMPMFGPDALTGNNRDIASSAGQLMMMRQMLAGLRMTVRVEPSGRLIRTNSPYLDGQTVTLFDLELDELLRDEQQLRRFQDVKSADDLTALLNGMPGLKLPVGDTTIEFTAR